VNRSALTQGANLLAAAGLLWSIGVGVWIWVTPIRFSGISSQMRASSSASGTSTSILRTGPVEQTRRFSDVSRLGPVPLMVPAAVAGLAALGVWRRRSLLLMLLPTAALLLFCFVAGFSIGGAYVPAGALLLTAVLISLASKVT
jgi:hypothetical protein